jgi:hypothetical protein
MVLGAMAPPSTTRPARPSRRGLVELLLVAGFLALAAAGAAALFGDELRQAFGAGATAPASAPRRG